MVAATHISVAICQAVLVAAAVIAGAQELPDYARPQFVTEEESIGIGTAGFGYRQLGIEDFQAASLQVTYDDEYDYRIQARSCISIHPSDDTMIRITRGTVSGRPVYIGRFATIAFQAVFNPDCSWWSPDVPSENMAYVLQHEQVHFALAELTARRLTHQAGRELEQAVFSSDLHEVEAELVERAKVFSMEGLTEDLRQHTAFDEETSLYFDPDALQKWYDEVTELLDR